MTVGGIATVFVVPPVNLAILGLLGLFLGRLGRLVSALCLLALIVLSLPVVSKTLLTGLESGLPMQAGTGPDAPGAIVVLGGDTVRLAGPDHPAAPGPLSLERMAKAASLARQTNLPVLVTGGSLARNEKPVATLIAQGLQNDFGTQARWTETESQHTWEKARFSAPLLENAGISRVYLVTQAWHMPRALLAFRHFGIEAVAAPVHLDELPTYELGEFVPRISAWANSYFGMHERIGLLYYETR